MPTVLLARVLRLALLLTAPVWILALPGCRDESAPAGSGRTYTDDLDRPVALESEVERVVSIAPSMTEIVHAAGGWGKLVGVTTADDYPPAVDTLSKFSAFPLDFEAVAALRPDLVLATTQINSLRDAESLEALGIPAYYFAFDELRDVSAAIRQTGELLGTEAAARVTADRLDAGFDSLRALSDTLSRRPRVLVLAGDEALYSFGGESFVHELVAVAGGRSVMDTVRVTAPVLSEEYVLRADPDYIIGIFGPDYDGRKLLELHPSWSNLAAVKNHRVYSLDGDLVSRPGPRLLDGARQLSAILNPPAPGAGEECSADAPTPCL